MSTLQNAKTPFPLHKPLSFQNKIPILPSEQSNYKQNENNNILNSSILSNSFLNKKRKNMTSEELEIQQILEEKKELNKIKKIRNQYYINNKDNAPNLDFKSFSICQSLNASTIYPSRDSMSINESIFDKKTVNYLENNEMKKEIKTSNNMGNKNNVIGNNLNPLNAKDVYSFGAKGIRKQKNLSYLEKLKKFCDLSGQIVKMQNKN